MIEFVKGRWRWYGVMPTNDQENAVYSQPSSHPRDRGQNINQFGAWKFDAICADFKPDIIIDIRDNWMLTWQLRSPFRKWTKLLWMPTVDAIPQAEEWMQDYEQADLVMAYSDFGVYALKQQSQRIRVFPKAMRPGVDLNTFKPMSRAEVRGKFGLREDVPVIGTVQRNQSRKLYPDLIDAFSLMKKKYKGETVVDKSVLLLHTCWPDNVYSYDYPRHVMRLQAYPWIPNHFKGIKDSVLQTFMCHNPECQHASIGFAMALYGRPIQNNVVPMPCCFCGKQTATCPTTGHGLTREGLAEIYNLMDLYVQCSICEGDGMPIQEAKACGVPALVVDYSAMREKGRFPKEYTHFKDLKINEENYSCHKGGDTIDIKRYYYEPETSCMRALPDIEDMANKMRNILTDQERHKQMSLDARKCVEDNYDWNRLWKQWEFVLDNVKIKDRVQTWDSPITVHAVLEPPKIPDNLSDVAYIDWLYIHIMKYPKVDSAGAEMWLQHLKNGITREQLLQQFLNISRQQENEDNARQSIRAEMARLSGTLTSSKKEDLSDNTWI
jgi:glycosyltransferase involved in cell wall biosynthesis